MRMLGTAALTLGLWAAQAQADDVSWRPVSARTSAPAVVAPAQGVPVATLGRPVVSLGQPTASEVTPVSYNPDATTPQPIIRAQAPDGPPPVPAPGAPATPLYQAPPPPPPGPTSIYQPPPPPVSIGTPYVGDERYNQGLVTDPNLAPGPGGRHPFWGKVCDTCGLDQFESRKRFQSDHCFDTFVSPVTNPFLFEDPRSLTEVRPIFIWQSIGKKNPATKGGDLEFFGVQGRLALTDQLSFVFNKLGGVAIQPNDKTGEFTDSTGFAELSFGPKLTFWRNENAGLLGAGGLNFVIPAGSSKVFQDTGSFSLVPYVSLGQEFFKTSYGSFHALESIGYSLGLDNQRTDYFYASLHLDYDVANTHHFYPLIELNWFHYTSDGGGGHPSTFGFEGRDLINFGSKGVSGHDEVSLAFGARFKYNEMIQFGGALEFPLTGTKDLLDFRLTLDVIFRY